MVDHSVFYYTTVIYNFQLCETISIAPHLKWFKDYCAQKKLSQDISCVRVSLAVKMEIATFSKFCNLFHKKVFAVVISASAAMTFTSDKFPKYSGVPDKKIGTPHGEEVIKSFD
ncbi:hypothetical protein T07_2963 [Trichinella nelsoni]|uniref:Uncharacterized protein n=1 Tax=Trichinella nelsoni TaxID=6336 RepID=A0A0V0SLS9_9BILA|nr:hypothetical protein T07_2963 [Trichinella nelsoni]